MRRLLIASLLHERRASLGPGIVFFVAGGFISLCLYVVASTASPTGQAALRDAPPGSESTVAQIAVFLMILGIGVPTCFVVSAVSNATLTQERSQLASWRLAGASPRQVREVILARLACVAVTSASAGALLAAPLTQTAMDYLLLVTTIRVPIPAEPGMGPGVLGVAVVAFVAVIGGIRPAVLAGRVPPAEAVRERRDTGKRLGLGQWIVAVAAAVASVFLAVGTAGQATPGAASTLALALAFGLALSLALLAPLYVGPLLGLWTRAIPPSAVPAWWLARSSGLQRLTTTSSAVAPVVIAMTVLGTYFSCSLSWEVATNSHAQGAVNMQQGIILFAPGAAIAVVGSAVVLFAVGGSRARERAQYRIAGAAPGTLVMAALAEAAMYVVTAALVAIPAVALATRLFVQTLIGVGLTGTFQIDPRPLLVCAAVGMVALALTTLLPVLRGLRRGDVAVLARDA